MRSPLVAAILGAAAAMFTGRTVGNSTVYLGSTPSKRYRQQPDYIDGDIVVSAKNDSEPRSYPGAKLARKAYRHQLGMCHP